MHRKSAYSAYPDTTGRMSLKHFDPANEGAIGPVEDQYDILIGYHCVPSLCLRERNG